MDGGRNGDALLMAPRTVDRRLARGRGFALARATARLRALPDFLVLGAMKAGTSSLFHHLARHPQVRGPYRKEVHYFGHGHRAGRSVGWYRAHFPRCLPRRGGPAWLTGEATPDYLYDPEVPARIRATLPEVRLIAILREPASRAVSHYFHEVRMGRERLPIEEAFALEEARLAHAAALGEAGRETLHHAGYRRRGLYAEQIERYLALFPRERLLLLGSAELRRDPEATLARAFAFLGLPPAAIDPSTARNEGSNKAPPPPPLVDELRAGFEAPNARLAALLGGLPDW